MNEYIFYTCEGYTYSHASNQEVENCQVLGREFGKNIEDARMNLMINSKWIVELGFDIDKSICKQILTEENKQDIRAIVNFFNTDEYKNLSFENGITKDYLSGVLKRLSNLVG